VTGPILETPPAVLSAPSGAGKTTIARALVDREEDFAFSVSATTRARRGKEVHGVDYWFLTRGEFLRMVEEGEFAEWAEVHGDLYGTPFSSLRKAGEGGRHVLLDIDVQGARQIREAVPRALLLFILPPSVDTLLYRLRGRGTEGEAAILRRLRTARDELEAAEFFDFFVVNDDLERSIAEVRTLIRTRRPPPEGSSGVLEDLVKLRGGVEALLDRDPLSDNQ
jgi:guanylate kinase